MLQQLLVSLNEKREACPFLNISSYGETMLVLTRKPNESILIGDDITITIVAVNGDKVRIGVDAPKEIPVHRQEVYEAIQKEKDN